MLIITLTCPVCSQKITTAQFESNLRMLNHHKVNHPQIVKLIEDNLMEIGKLKDRIDTIAEDTKRLTGYKVTH